MNSVSFFKSFISKYGVELSLIILIGCGYYYFKGYIVSDRRAALTGEFQEAVSQIKAIAERAESAEKAFVQNGKEGDLKEYNQEIMLLNHSMGALNKLAENNPDQKKDVSRLNETLRSYFENLNGVLSQRQRGNVLKNRVPAQSSISQAFDNVSSFSSATKQIPLPKKNVLFLFFAFIVGVILLSRFWQKQELKKQKQKSLSLQHRSVLLDTILNSMSEGLVVVDKKQSFTHYNAAAQRIIGTKIKELSSETAVEKLGFFNVTTGEPYTLKQLPFHKAMNGEQVDDLEIFVQNETHPDGVYISLSSRSINDINGGISGALVVFKDVTRRKMVEQEWIRAREAALEASVKKSDFLAAMSHEIRTPMNGVIGMATLLSDTPLNDEQKDYVGIVKRSAESLLMLINDILDHSKIEAGKIQLLHEPFDLQFLINDVLEMFRAKALEKNIELKVEMQTDSPWYFIGDAGRFRQILINLVGNAVKFTNKGSVCLQVSRNAAVGNDISLKFQVKDTGPGLKEEERRSLFQKYFQTKNGMKNGGTGLGLSISKQLVDLMNGEIGVDSIVGLGSNFWFAVTLQKADLQEASYTKVANFSPVFSGRVLLVEDQLVNQRVAQTFLRKLGLQVDLAGNGLVAYEKCLAQKYDLIFMDCQMPVLNGFEATVRIRKEEAIHGGNTPIIALTADATVGDKSFYSQYGMTDFLAKPLELNALVEMLHKYMPRFEPIDEEVLNKLVDYAVNDQSLIQALIQDFEQTAPELIETMWNALGEENFNVILNSAHALKSSSATLGALRLAELCEIIENLPDATDISKTRRLIEEVELQFANSLSGLKVYGEQKKAAS
ncbi:MAG: response regulator [Pseudobdellovibrionaceae bacterium]